MSVTTHKANAPYRRPWPAPPPLRLLARSDREPTVCVSSRAGPKPPGEPPRGNPDRTLPKASIVASARYHRHATNTWHPQGCVAAAAAAGERAACTSRTPPTLPSAARPAPGSTACYDRTAALWLLQPAPTRKRGGVNRDAGARPKQCCSGSGGKQRLHFGRAHIAIRMYSVLCARAHRAKAAEAGGGQVGGGVGGYGDDARDVGRRAEAAGAIGGACDGACKRGWSHTVTEGS